MSFARGAPEPELQPHQESMLQACSHGRLAELQELFQAHDVQKGDAEVGPVKVPMNGPPNTISMFIAAIDHNQLAIVKYLLSIYQAVDLKHPSIADAIVRTKNLDILRLVVHQSPQIASFEYDNMTTFVIELCREGPCAEPLVDFLLDQNPSLEGGMRLYFSCLGIGMAKGLSVGVLRKMLDNGVEYHLCMIEYAIQLKRADAVQLMLDWWRGRIDASQENELREELEKCTDKQIVALVNKFIRKRRVGSGGNIRSVFAYIYQQLARIRIPYSSPKRETEMAQVKSKELLEKIIDEDESE